MEVTSSSELNKHCVRLSSPVGSVLHTDRKDGCVHRGRGEWRPAVLGGCGACLLETSWSALQSEPPLCSAWVAGFCLYVLAMPLTICGQLVGQLIGLRASLPSCVNGGQE